MAICNAGQPPSQSADSRRVPPGALHRRKLHLAAIRCSRRRLRLPPSGRQCRSRPEPHRHCNRAILLERDFRKAAQLTRMQVLSFLRFEFFDCAKSSVLSYCKTITKSAVPRNAALVMSYLRRRWICIFAKNGTNGCAPIFTMPGTSSLISASRCSLDSLNLSA